MSDSRADQTRYAAERAMEPILRRWFAIDLEPVNLWSNAENAAVDLSYALEDAGLLLPIQFVIKGAMSADRTAFTHGLEHPSDAALAALTPRPADEVVIDGKRWRVIPSGFGYDDGSQSCRLVPTEVAQDQVDWRVMALRVKHENAGPECFCENPKPGAHAQSCPRFGMNP